MAKLNKDEKELLDLLAAEEPVIVLRSVVNTADDLTDSLDHAGLHRDAQDAAEVARVLRAVIKRMQRLMEL